MTGAISAGPAAAAGTAGTPPAVARLGLAQPIPGLAALNQGGSARVNKVSCASAGDCAAVGLYQDASHHDQVFAAFEKGGTWLAAAPIPKLNALNAGGNADVSSLSCPEAGDCTAGGSYTDARGNNIPWAADSAGGSWYQTKSLITPDLATIDMVQTHEGIARVNAMSCAAPGSCEAVLSIPFPRGGSLIPVPYLAAEIGGLWDEPEPATLTTKDTLQDWAELLSVSCGHSLPADPVTFCIAGGYYIDQHGHEFAMIGFGPVGDVVPGWGGFGDPFEDPAVNHLRNYAGGTAQVATTSCLPSGFCSWGGFYRDTHGAAQPFTGTFEDGPDGTEDVNATIPGILELNAGAGFVDDLSCTLPRRCAVAGSYTDSVPRNQAYVDTDLGNGYSDAQGIDGITNSSRAGAGTVSCPPDGGCVAGGFFDDAAGRTQAFITDQNLIAGSEGFGSFSGAREVAGNLNSGGNAGVTSVSCGTATDCAIGGFYTDAGRHQQAFIAEQSTVTVTSISVSAKTVAVGHEHSVHITAKVSPSAAGQQATGTVTVKAGGTRLGKATLTGGKATFVLPAAKLRPGTYKLTARYGGDPANDASTSASKTLTVTGKPTSTALALSTPNVSLGHEQSEKLTVQVKPQLSAGASASAIPAGKVTVRTGATTLCVITLKSAKGSCQLSSSELSPGKYPLTASYAASSPYAASTSARKTLTVTK